MSILPDGADKAATPQQFVKFPATLWGQLTPIELAVYLAIATHADKSGVAFPSLSTIANDARCARSSAQKALADLQARNLIACTKKSDRGRWKANVYSIAVPPVPPHGNGGTVPPVPPHGNGQKSTVTEIRTSPLPPGGIDPVPPGGNELDKELTRSNELDGKCNSSSLEKVKSVDVSSKIYTHNDELVTARLVDDVCEHNDGNNDDEPPPDPLDDDHQPDDQAIPTTEGHNDESATSPAAPRLRRRVRPAPDSYQA